MNFRDWIIAEEDVKKLDTSGVQLEPYTLDVHASQFKSYQRKFIVGEQQFKVLMVGGPVTYEFEQVPGAFSISFEGPNGYDLTRNAGTMAHTIYTQLLVSIKKLFEVTDVNLLMFTAADPTMELVYQRFYKQYLSKEFIQVSHNKYVKKDYIRQTMKGRDDWEKQSAYSSILNTGRLSRSNAAAIRQKKDKLRQARMRLPKLVGQFVYFTNVISPELIFITYYNVSNPEYVEGVYNAGNNFYQKNFPATSFAFDVPVTNAEIKDFLQGLGSSHLIHTDAGKLLIPWLQRFKMPIEEKPTQNTMTRNSQYARGWDSL